jgi:hypothetical protein
VYKRVFGKRVLVEIVFVQGTDLCRSPFALERLLLLTDSYAIAYSINIELSQAQLSFSIYETRNIGSSLSTQVSQLIARTSYPFSSSVETLSIGSQQDR